MDIQVGRFKLLGLSTVEKHSAMSNQQENAAHCNLFCTSPLKLLASIESYFIGH